MAVPCRFFLLALSLAMFSPPSVGRAEDPVRMCGENWPPFIYAQVGKDESGYFKKTGTHLNLFATLSNLTGLKFSIDLIPWQRCLEEVENFGSKNKYEIALDATFNEERARKYHYVGPIYSTGTSLFFSRTKFPNGPRLEKSGKIVSTINEMQQFKICGLLGWNYESYYTLHDIPRSIVVQQTSGGLGSVLRMVAADRCDLFEAPTIVVIGAVVTGQLSIPDDIACLKLAEEQQPFYLMVSRSTPRALELVSRMTTALERMEKSGTLKYLTNDSLKQKGSPSLGILSDCL